VLTVAKITGSSAAGYADYLEGKAQAAELGDYYLKDGERVEAPGRWVAGARAVGRDDAAPVTGDVLRALMAVQRPDNREPLRQVGGSGHAVAALDATFSAPKTVSAMWALADPELREQIETAHEQAIDRALDHAVRHVAMVRQRTDEAITHLRATELIATSWRHTTARAAGNRLPDPQLHSHVLLHAAVRKDGRLVAIDSRSWLVHRRELGAAYRTELATELAKLGFGIERGTGRGGRYFELAGVPSELIDQWSSRHHQVRQAIHTRLAERRTEIERTLRGGNGADRQVSRRLAALDRAGRVTAAEDRLLTARSRSRKRPVTHRDLDRQWAQDGGRAGLAASALAGLRRQGEVWKQSEPALVERGLTEFDATFTLREARAVALEVSCGVPIEPALETLKELREQRRLLGLADGTLTTASHRAAERAAVQAADEVAAQTAEGFEPEVVEGALSDLEAELADRGGELTDEQQQAVRLACSERAFVMIEGQAGTGKSTVLQAVARAHQASGQLVVVTSTSALAAQRLAGELTEAGVEAVCFSTVALMRAVEDRRLALNPWVTLMHDEAAMASTRELRPLLTEVERTGARIIMLGDPAQSHPVGAGGLWPQLDRAATGQDASVQLSRNVRALDPADRRDQKRFRSGAHELALRGYAARHRLHLHDEQCVAESGALEAAHLDRQAGRRTLIIAQTSNDHLDELNAHAQALRLQDGELGEASLTLAGRPYRLHEGDHIQVRHTVNLPDHGVLRNGTMATTSTVDTAAGTAGLQLSSGEVVRVNQDQLDQAETRLAYVQHPFPAQGTTSETAHLIVGPHVTQEGSYVALTRARQSTHIYASEELLDDGDEAEPWPSWPDKWVVLSQTFRRSARPLAHEQEITQRGDAESSAGAAREGEVARPRLTDWLLELLGRQRGRPEHGAVEQRNERDATAEGWEL
jgi:conjugative relaxase-like TrwC/TraI family protein